MPVLLVLLVMFTTGLCLFLACANLFFRDVKYLVQVFTTFGIFFTPVFFDVGSFGRKGQILMLNPIAPILEGLRLAITQAHNLATPLTIQLRSGITSPAWEPWQLAYSAVWAIGGLLLSAVLFRRASDSFAEYI